MLEPAIAKYSIKFQTQKFSQNQENGKRKTSDQGGKTKVSLHVLNLQLKNCSINQIETNNRAPS